jgi:hypothetical protein
VAEGQLNFTYRAVNAAFSAGCATTSPTSAATKLAHSFGEFLRASTEQASGVESNAIGSCLRESEPKTTTLALLS